MPAGLGDATTVNESGMRTVSLSGAFGDADGGDLTVTAVSSNYRLATTQLDGSILTVVGTGEDTATITVTEEDPDGNRVSDQFKAKVRAAFAGGESAIPGRSPGARTHLRGCPAADGRQSCAP